MLTQHTHPHRVDKTSEFIGIVLILSAIGLQQVAPMEFPRLVASWSFRRPTGLFLVFSFALILRTTHAELAKYKQPREPGKATTRLVKTGPFRYSRNPTYTSIIMLLQPGLALLFDHPWLICLEPLSIVMFWYIMIREEEEYLQIKFREGWGKYCQKTRRWV